MRVLHPGLVAQRHFTYTLPTIYRGFTKDRGVPPCAVRTCAVRPVFARVVGELRAANPSKRPRAREAKC